MIRRPPAAVSMWAVVLIGPRTEWIAQDTIRPTRKAAITTYLEWWDESYRPQQARARGKKWRVARVRVELE